MIESCFIQKVVLVIFIYQNQILISHENRKNLRNLWEFPGGKVKDNENIYQSAIREIKEEIGLEIKTLQSLGHYFSPSLKHSKLLIYPFYTYLTTTEIKKIKAKINQDLRFVQKNQLLSYPFLKGSYGAIYRYLLPNEYMITDEPEDDFLRLIDSWQFMIEKGVRLIQLRAKKCSKKTIMELAKVLKKNLKRHNGYLFINSKIEIAESLNVGIHLTSKQLQACSKRVASKKRLVSTSCHNQKEVHQAQKYADIALLSPIKTNHYSNSPFITPDQFSSYSREGLVTYALSGMNREDIAWIQSLGGQGIAGISAFKMNNSSFSA